LPEAACVSFLGRSVVLPDAAYVLFPGRRVVLPGAAPVLLPTAAISGTLCHWKDGFARFVQLVRP
jgi:hypothetical protein